LEDGGALSVSLADHPDLGADGGFVTLEGKGAAPAMLLVRDGQTVRAFVNLCTHAACPLRPDAANGVIHCDRDCGHGSIYSMDGEVIQGPSERSLYEFESALDETGEELTIQMVLKPA
jgi:Rieske Fe-S protein